MTRRQLRNLLASTTVVLSPPDLADAASDEVQDVPSPEDLKPGPRRAKTYHNRAVKFGRRFPIGTTIDEDTMDNWLISEMPIDQPTDRAKGSEGWQAFLTRRHWAIWKINQGAKHERINETGVRPFTIKSLGRGRHEVVGMTDAITDKDVPLDVIMVAMKRYKEICDYHNSIPPAHLDQDTERLYKLIVNEYRRYARSIQQLSGGMIESLATYKEVFGVDRLPSPSRRSLSPPSEGGTS